MKKSVNTKSKYTVKASCGGQGCSVQPYVMPFGWAYEAFDFEARTSTKIVKTKERR